PAQQVKDREIYRLTMVKKPINNEGAKD
ncbi:NADH-quinone oxidoreductase subunit J, partial [Francisella tularensis subsp. holarctica]|nr:NADH-quinone oxidoreductase subunit J [Francisella tularensis subsp. holarctica]